jgi:transcriptional regulator with XRE-family HTH domain
MNFNKSFKIIRAATGLSQDQFANKVGIEPSLISRIESGKRIPTKKTIDSIAAKLSVPIELIELLAKEPQETKKISNDKLTVIGQELLGLLVKNNYDLSFWCKKISLS